MKEEIPGICICGIPFKEHPKCDSCGIFGGENHPDFPLFQYKQRTLCSVCKEESIFIGLTHD